MTIVKSSHTWLIALLNMLALAWGLAQEPVLRPSWHDANGNRQGLSDYQGKIVVLNFWATWCAPCQHEMPILANLQNKYQNRDVVVLGASLDKEKAEQQVEAFAEKHKIPFPILLGATTGDMEKLDLGEAIPATAFIDQSGRVIGRVLGELDKSDLEHRIEWMLGNHRGREPAPFVDRLKRKEPQSVSVFGPY